MDNYMRLKIKAVSSNEAFARSAVAAFCVDANPTVDKLADVKTAVSEAVTNSIVHGYNGSGEGEVERFFTEITFSPAAFSFGYMSGICATSEKSFTQGLESRPAPSGIPLSNFRPVKAAFHGRRHGKR